MTIENSLGAAERGDPVTVDRAEVARFARMAASWWDPEGEFRPLHRLNPVRVAFIRDRLVRHFARDSRALAPFAGLRLLDIGCGGGLVAEPMARLGFAVTAIDADRTALGVARAHAAAMGLAIDYREAAVEDLAGASFDAVVALEVVEHVRDRPAFLAATVASGAPGRRAGRRDAQPHRTIVPSGHRRRRICSALAAARDASLGEIRAAVGVGGGLARRRDGARRGVRRRLRAGTRLGSRPAISLPTIY